MWRRAVIALLIMGSGWLSTATADPPRRHVRAISEGGEALGAALEAEGFDVLEGGISPGAVELIVTEAELEQLRRRASRVEVLGVSRALREAPAGEGVLGYPTLDEVYQRMRAAAEREPDLCRFVDLTAELGTTPTVEGRHLYAVKLSTNVHLNEDEPAALIVSLHHAREIVTPLIALHAMDQLLDSYGHDPVLTEILDTQEIWIAPIWNPDGYVHVFERDRYWRKNRRDNGDGTFGVDLNRNYPFGWDSACGGALATSSEVYRGPSPASEAETQTMMAWTERERFARVLDFHSFGRETLFGYRCAHHPLGDFLAAEARRISAGAGYGSRIRPPSAEGEHYEWQLSRGAFAFLVETHIGFQPPLASGQAEAEQVFGGIVELLRRPPLMTGVIRDESTGEPIEGSLSLPQAPYRHGEAILSARPTGAYHLFAPDWISTISAIAEDRDPRIAIRVAEPRAPTIHDFHLPRRLEWSFPGGLPAFIASWGGDRIRVEVAATGARAPEPGTGMLHVDTGAGFEAVAMDQLSPNVYQAILPPVECFGKARFFFSVLDTAGRPAFAPAGDGSFTAVSGEGARVTPPAFGDLHDWVVESFDLERGQWAYGKPLGDGSLGDPVTDSDGDGLAWLTGAAPGEDVDGGPTVLTSPAYDLSGFARATLGYDVWFSSMGGLRDFYAVEFSNDDGAQWELAGFSRAESDGWRRVEFEISSILPLTDQMRIRFTTADSPDDSITEVGIDAFEIVAMRCSDCRADLTGDGELDFFDFLMFQNLFAAGDPRADFDGSGALDFFDFLAFQNEFAAGCR